MADNLSKKDRRKTMQAVKSKNTRLESDFVNKLQEKGIRFRRNVKDLVGKPDIAIKKYKLVIFIDSCFWHRCPYHYEIPKTNKKYWEMKLYRNKTNDKKVNKWYFKNNWILLRFWEHKLKKDIERCVNEVSRTIEAKKKRDSSFYTI